MPLIISISLFYATLPLYPVEINDRSEFLLDVRGDDGNILLNHVSINKKIDPLEINISSFGQVQWNLKKDEWEKLTLGLSATKNLWKYLYASQSVQLISGQILDHMKFDVDNKSIDSTTRIGLDVPIFKKLSFNIAQELSFNLEKGKSEYCESIAEIIYSPGDRYSLGIGWRHTDRIHSFDTDYVTTSLSLRF